ncbi:MAG: bacteriophage holin [candidate division Zixibacteria bacterium]|nr:bacteriophage holin [candidate division Zixibacteria bacterium]
MKLNVKAFALTCGLVWGCGLLCITWWIMLFEGVSCDQTLIGQVYRGYDISPVGSLVGLLWGLVDGFIGGAIFAWLYNRLAGKMV